MDTYEHEDLTPDAVSGGTDQPMEPTDGFYHGVGTGVTENTTSEAQPVQESGVDHEEQQDTVVPKRTGKKLGKAVIAGVTVLAIVIAGCGISVGLMSRYWKNQNQLLMRRVEEQMAVLQQKLDAYKDADISLVIPSVEGMTPSQIYQKNINSVVAVNCVVQTSNMGQIMESASAGSGFVMTEDGYIVTNHHVISGATSITVSFVDGTKMNAKLIGSDANNDVALLKVEAKGLQPVTIGSSSSLRVGDQVVAIGNALGELSFSLTAGYVSGMDRDVTTDGTVINMIQTDVAINSGNSGGPLFNAKGEVVGITSAKYSGTTSSGASIEGISFAIPMDDVYGMLEDLQQYGYIKTAYLGIMAQEVGWDKTYADTYGLPLGVYVKSVVSGGCADKAGLRNKDIITNLGGYDIENLNDLSYALRKLEPGKECTITVWRAGQGEVIFSIVLDEKVQG